MKAIILVAGRGTRLRPLTDKVPKCLLEVGGKSVLERQLEVLHPKVKDILLVLGYKKELVLEKINLKHVINEDYKSTNSIHSLWLAKDFMDDDTLIINGDVLFDENLFENFMATRHNISVALTIKWNPGRGYKVKISDNKVLEMGMDINPVYGEYAGFILVRKGKLNFFKNKLEQMHKNNNTLWFEDVISQMAKESEDVGFFDVSKFSWYEFDTLEEYQIAKRMWRRK